MPKIFDTHAHYTDSRFDEYPGKAAALIEEMPAAGVGNIINVAVDTQNSLDVIRQARSFENMYAAVGIHPTEAWHEEGGLDGAMSRLRSLLEGKEKNKIVAVGEIGLDYHYENTDKALQQSFFEAQLELAQSLDIPVIIHDRDAHGDCFETVLKYPKVRGVFHSYSGSAEMAKELIRRGWYISFSGVISFKNAPRVREVCSSVPLERLLCETDAPYLAPEPYRGKCNRSDYITYTAQAIGRVFGISCEEILRITEENAKKLFLKT